MTKKIKYFVQAVAVIVFIALLINGNANSWMIVFLIGLIGSTLLGRFYCGWLCPINTAMDGISCLTRLNKIKQRKVPNFFRKKAIRYIFLLLIVGLIIGFGKAGVSIPLLPFLLILGVLTTIFFLPNFWHKYLCPYGTLLSLTGRAAKLSWRIDQALCTKCMICKKVCPAGAVHAGDKGEFPIIESKYCIECMKCVKACPQDAITYGRNKNLAKYGKKSAAVDEERRAS